MTKKRNDNRYAAAAATVIVAVAAVAIVVVAALKMSKGIMATKLGITTEQSINPTPARISEILSIGQWEFLEVSDEELVDTVRKRLFREDQLARIYYGTLRIGIDLSSVSPSDIRVEGDSVSILLPPVGLLDSDFIDEARTTSFHEQGKWTAADREALLKKARTMMLRRGMTAENIAAAERNGQQQVEQMLRTIGFKSVSVSFRKASSAAGKPRSAR